MKHLFIFFILISCTLNCFSQKSNTDILFKSFESINFEKLNTNEVYMLTCNARGVYSSSPTAYHSKGMRCLFDIYKLYVGKNKKDEYYLKNSCYLIKNQETEQFVNDIKKTVEKVQLNKVAIGELKTIYLCYKKWIRLVKKKGINYVQKKKIGPLDKTIYSWEIKG